jgi:hypothetical protein
MNRARPTVQRRRVRARVSIDFCRLFVDFSRDYQCVVKSNKQQEAPAAAKCRWLVLAGNIAATTIQS